MKANGNYFTGVAYNFAALLIGILLTGAITACGNLSEKVEQKKTANLEAEQEKADAGLRDALAIESQLRSEQVFLGVSSYLRADAVSAMRVKLANTNDNELLQLRSKITSYKKQIVLAIRAVENRLIFLQGSQNNLTDRRDTAEAFLIEVKSELAARKL